MGLRFFLLIALAALALAFTLWLLELREGGIGLDPQAGLRVPDYTLEGITLTATDETGRVQYRIDASALAHYSDDNSTEFENPVIQFFRGNEPPYQVTSARAWVAGARDEIRLLGEVDIIQPQTKTRKAYTVKTRDVRVFPQQKSASTEQPLVAVAEHYLIQGEGGEIDLLTGDVRIYRRARGVYEP